MSRLYVDMDGVLVDLVSAIWAITGRDPIKRPGCYQIDFDFKALSAR